MIKIGEYNELIINRFVDFGAYMSDPADDEQNRREVLLPGKYLPDGAVIGDIMRVFVYTDSEDRPVATTQIPFVTVGQFAFLQAEQTGRFGAFLDWGLPKNLLVPFKEQRVKMYPGGIYLVYVYLDKATNRVVASAKINKFLGNVYPDYRIGQRVEALVIAHNAVGYQVIVDNKHYGMIYSNELYQNLEIEQTVSAYVKHVRPDDGKIDLTLTAPGTLGRIEKLEEKILELLSQGRLTVNDKSTPDEISALLHCSKKDFKKALGALYRDHRIIITPQGITLP